MILVSKPSTPRLVAKCDLPLAGRGPVSRVLTALGGLEVTGYSFELVELALGVDYARVAANTAAPVTGRMAA